MDSKKIAKLAKKFAKLEKEMEYDEDVADVQQKMDELSDGLTPDDLFAIDEYIREHHLVN